MARTKKETNNIPAEPKKKKVNYLNNKDLLAQVVLSKQKGRMTETLGHMIMVLVERYSKHPWFLRYTYREDMEGFARYTVVKMWNNFNPDKGSNPFAYFTQIIKNAFYQYILAERKQRQIRDKILINQGENPSYNYQDDNNYDYDNDNMFFQKLDNFEQEEFKKMNEALAILEENDGGPVLAENAVASEEVISDNTELTIKDEINEQI